MDDWYLPETEAGFAGPTDPPSGSAPHLYAGLKLLGWTVSLEAVEPLLVFDKISIPEAETGALCIALTGEPPGRTHNVPHEPLEQMLAVVGLGTYFVRANDRHGLDVFVLRGAAETGDLLRRFTAAVAEVGNILGVAGQWRGRLTPYELARAIDRAARVTTVRVSAALEHGEVSTRPRDPLLFTALQCVVRRLLDGLPMTYPVRGRLVALSGGAGAFAGAEFVFSPCHARGVRNEHCAEVATLSSATLAGSRDLFILLTLSTRRWRPIPAESTSMKARTIDLFPRDADGQCRRYHTLRLDRRGPAYANLVAHRIVTGRLPPAGTEPPDYMSGKDAALLPVSMARFATGMGDRYMGIGSGTSYLEREAFYGALSAALAPHGFREIGVAPEVERSSGRAGYAPWGARRWTLKDGDEAREALTAVLDQYGRERTLRVATFAMDEDFDTGIRKAFEDKLGAPACASHADHDELAWPCGLRTLWFRRPSGPFATRMDIRYKAQVEEEAGRSLPPETTAAERREAVEGAWRTYAADALDGARRGIDGHAAACVGGLPERDDGALAVAFVQMHETTRDDAYRDPFLAVKRSLARRGFVSQMFLGPGKESGAPAEDGAPPGEEPATVASKLRACVEDALRMLGVPGFRTPVHRSPAGDVPVAMAALYAIRRNKGEFGGRYTLPVAVIVRGGATYVAVPDGKGAFAWEPYPDALRGLLTGRHDSIEVPGRRNPGAPAVLFCRNVLIDIDRSSEHAVVLVESQNLRSWLPTLSNARLNFDRVEFDPNGSGPSAALELTSADLSRTRILRIVSETGKIPTYALNLPKSPRAALADAQDADGQPRRKGVERQLREKNMRRLTWAGIASNPAAPHARERVFLLVKRRPDNMMQSSFMMTQSRHLNQNVEKARDFLLTRPRAAPTLDELTALFVQDGDDPVRLAELVAETRNGHPQYNGDTRLPPPLHELHLLRYAVVGREESEDAS